MPSAAIYDCEGPQPTADEAAFFRDVDPLGFILFARHCADAEAIRRHVGALKSAVGRDDVLILIDQEGGRVQRMGPPAFRRHPPPGAIGALWARDPGRARRAARASGAAQGALLSEVGVNVNCVPMLDVPSADAHAGVMGDRAFSDDPDVVAELGRAQAEGLLAAGVLPVVKHLPGHGRARVDSHEAPPRVDAPRAALSAVDFAPFRALADAPLGMTAHVVYEALDPDRCASLSPRVIAGTVRGEIGFDGLLLCDDLKMKALGGPLEARAAGALEAGCDAVLACNFTLDEKRAVAPAVGALTPDAAARADRAFALLEAMRGGRPAPGEAAVAAAYAALDDALAARA